MSISWSSRRTRFWPRSSPQSVMLSFKSMLVKVWSAGSSRSSTWSGSRLTRASQIWCTAFRWRGSNRTWHRIQNTRSSWRRITVGMLQLSRYCSIAFWIFIYIRQSGHSSKHSTGRYMGLKSYIRISHKIKTNSHWNNWPRTECSAMTHTRYLRNNWAKGATKITMLVIHCTSWVWCSEESTSRPPGRSHRLASPSGPNIKSLKTTNKLS